MNLPTVAIDARLAGGTSTGDSSYWSGLLYGLSNLHLDFRVLLFSNADAPSDIPKSPNFSWIKIPARSSRWWSYVAFPLAARRQRATAIHTQYSLSPLAGNRGITTIHDVSFLIGPEWFQPKDRMILNRTVPGSARRARKVIAVSKTGAAEIEKYLKIPADKIAAIYNGLPPWIHIPDHPEQILNKLGLARPYLLTVGTRWPRKNMELAIDATRSLEDMDLVLTGKSGWGDANTGSHVKSVGYVSNDELCALYSQAQLYVAPSRHEGFGIPVIEAFACGCPVLCSSGGALPEVAGDAAEIEPTWEPQHWNQTIRNLLSDSSKLHELRRRGFERVKMFDWIDSARETADVYREVMA
ncbi:MAG TPA: glycosyltransferase family 1 protein [Fimbriimonadaceae bacterium]|nr:glycosyltransferase family 1 protein [Fimbriimonadaceae bacterium]